MKMKNKYKKMISSKGWKQKDLAIHWNFTVRHISSILKNPSQLQKDAVEGLQDFKDIDFKDIDL